MFTAENILKRTIQALLFAIVLIVPFVRIDALYFPFVSGKAYLFRVLIAIAFFFWTWLMLQKKEYRPNLRNILVGAIIIFFFTQTLASLFGVDPFYSLFSSIERSDGVLQYGFWMLYFLMFVSVFRKRQDWKLFFVVFILSALASSMYSLYDQGWQTQLYGRFGNPAYFAAFLIFAIGVSLIVFERKFFYPGPVHYAFLVAAGFLVLALVLTQVRGAYAGLAGGALLFSLLCIAFFRKVNRKLVFACGSILILGVVSLGALFVAKDTEFVQGRRMLYRITEVTEIWGKPSTRERLLNWVIALKAFKERPIFGYGPENYGAAANKYYDYRVGVEEPWFDRAHNQPLDTLATGGIVVFAAYLFWLAAAVFLILKITKRQRILGFLLASIFFAYFLEGFFLFDLLAVYLGLFPFLAFLIYEKERGEKSQEKEDTKYKISISTAHWQNIGYLALVPVALVSVAVIYFTAVVPYKASAAAIKFYVYTEHDAYKESKPFLEESFAIRSPYTYWEVRKRSGWQFVTVLDRVEETTGAEKLKEIGDLYEFIALEFERFIEARPYDPQGYFALGRMYRLGYEKLGRDDLAKAEVVLKKAFQYSDLRAEYFNELAQVLLLQGKFDEGEKLVKDYTARITLDEAFPYITLGHFYFVAKKYDQAIEQYEKARALRYNVSEVDMEYNRFIFAAQEVGAYQKIVDVAKEYLGTWGPNADAYFNIAVGYSYLGDKARAREFFLKAIELNPEYKQQERFFTE